MPARRTYSAVALVVGASGVLLACVFGFLSFVPHVDPSVGQFFQLSFFLGGVAALGGLVGYFVTSRKADSGEPLSRFDRALEQRKAALGTLPVGLLAVLVGALWYVIHDLGQGTTGLSAPSNFADFDTPGIIAFLGFGSLYVAIGTWMAIRAERAAIRAAREDAGVAP
jgi:hypothetical protein